MNSKSRIINNTYHFKVDLRFGKLTVLSSMYIVEHELALVMANGESYRQTV